MGTKGNHGPQRLRLKGLGPSDCKDQWGHLNGVEETGGQSEKLSKTVKIFKVRKLAFCHSDKHPVN